MPTTIPAAFERLRQNLQITGLQEHTVSTRQENVRDVVATDLTVLDSFLTGSYKRDTMIAPLAEADVDIFIVLDPAYYSSGGQAALLNRVRSALRRTYTRTPAISPNGQAVTITFSDFKVDVIPGFYRNGGGFLIPDSHSGTWIATNPKTHVALWSEANKRHNGHLIPLIKMMKGWNKPRGLFRSFHLEVLILAALNNIRIDDYPSGVRFVFDKIRYMIHAKAPDPAGFSDDVASYINTREKMNALADRATWAYNISLSAEQLASQGRLSEAYDKWRLIFKDYFPAYG